VEVGGERRKAWKFLLRMMYSGRKFAWLYQRRDQLAFLDGYERAFACLNGVVRRCMYDYAARHIVVLTCPRRLCCLKESGGCGGGS
jgi:hypothetical protein